MTRRRRRTIDIFNISFLDVISCGFGAIILLLVIVKVAEPRVIEKSFQEIAALASGLREQLKGTLEEAERVEQGLQDRQERLSQVEEGIRRSQQELSRLEQQQDDGRLDLKAQAAIEQQLKLAQQRLSNEQKRLQGASYRRSVNDALIGGVPVDSEYIIFIIDTSGSMQKFAWRLVRKKVAEVLEIYPKVKGIQIMNDMGEYMFSQYKGRWIPDTAARRKAILQRLSNWAPFSNSSPVEGVQAAIERFYSPDRKISLYIFGDDFSRGSIERVVTTIGRLNTRNASGRRRVRVHAVGFPVILQHSANQASGIRFAALMRKLAESNDGSFVGLNSSSP